MEFWLNVAKLVGDPFGGPFFVYEHNVPFPSGCVFIFFSSAPLQGDGKKNKKRHASRMPWQ
jgi:hypothetical protein